MGKKVELSLPSNDGKSEVTVTVEATDTGYNGTMQGGSADTVTVHSALEAFGIDPDEVTWRR